MLLDHWTSAAKIKGISKQICEVLVESGKVKKVSDLYYLGSLDFIEAFKICDSRKIKHPYAEKLYKEIQKSVSNVSFEAFLVGLAIKNAGGTTCAKLARKFPNIDSLYESLGSSWNIEDISKVYEANIKEDLKEREEDVRLLYKLVKPKNRAPKSKALQNVNMCITGTLSKRREFFVKILVENGGVFHSNVSRNTDYLLAGGKTGSKLSKAKSLGIKVISEEDFYKLLKDNV